MLQPRSIHLYHGWLRHANWPSFLDTLSPDERQRARSLHFERDARRFTISHYVLRRVLAGYVGEHPGAIRFSQNGHSKPTLECGSGPKPLHFNMSHSGEMVVVGVAEEPLGVDVECLGRRLDTESIARHFFSTAENAELKKLPLPLRRDAFLAGWTRKEAFVKALGSGLSTPIRVFETRLDPRLPVRILRIHGDAAEAKKWSVLDVRIARDYVAAAVAAGPGWRMEVHHFHFGSGEK